MSQPPAIEDWHTDPWDDPAELYRFESSPAPGDRPVLKWVVFAVVVVVLAGLLVAGAAGMWLVRQLNPPGEAGEAVNFTVNADDTVESVAARLKDEGIITNARVFEGYVERKGGVDLVPGYYTLRRLDTMGNILGTLRTPPELTYIKVTFPEGFTLEQMGARLASKVPRLVADEFVAASTGTSDVRSVYQPEGVSSLEGLLFPDTYQVGGNEDEDDVVRRMAKLMERVGGSVGLEDGAARLGITPYDVLKVASMIEREAKVDEDRALIARVIYNRLFFGMPLQIDATLYYQQDENRPFSELKELDTPYNTYLYKGLPPTPIANPGRASIEAALRPAPNPERSTCPPADPCIWLYYVLADDDGRHAFATNLADHESNVRKARAAGLLD